MLRALFPLVLLCFSACLLVAQPDSARMKGLLWEISGRGLARPSYLYGTMHVPEKLAFNLSDSFFVALRQADMVALETDHDQWQAFTEQLNGRQNDMLNGAESALPAPGDSRQPDLYNTPFRFQTPANQLLGAILSAKPRMTNEFLYRSNQYRQDYEEDTYLDLFIFQAGRKLGKPVVGLETLEESYEAFVRAQIPDPDENTTDRNRYAAPPYTRATLDEAYRDQDLDLLDSINKLTQPSRNFQRWMLDNRNAVMARRIDSILQAGQSLFSAVGAAHLPGETGLIRQLRQWGYALRPVQFSSVSAKKEKETIEALDFPVQLARQWAPDSSWSAEAPRRFYQTVDAQGLEQLLCADMSNGAYYAVYHLRTFGFWNGQSPDFMIDRIDSLIYEKIPGKILERRRGETPYPNHEITTRTRRGDILRFRIFANPMDIYVFATGGNGDYAAGEPGTRFLNSIRFYFPSDTTQPGPVHIQPAGGGFELMFPVAPSVNTTDDKKADRFLLAGIDPADSACYLFCQAEYHDWNFIEEDTFELNILGEKIAAAYTDQLPESRLIATAPFPMQDFEFRLGPDSACYYFRLIISGPHYFLLGCRKRTPGAPMPFFESFRIAPTQYPDAWETLRDTNLMFEARVPAEITTSELPYFVRLKGIVAEGMRRNSRNLPFGSAFPRLQTRLLELPLQQEKIRIQSVEMMAAGAAPALDSFQRAVRKRLTNQNKLALREETWALSGDSLLTGQFVMYDTNSTRKIRAKVVVTPGRVYTLMAAGQQGVPASAFVQTFFESFTPIDSARGRLPFGRRDLQFLQYLYAGDSLLRTKALARLETTSRNFYEAADYEALKTVVEHPAFGQLEFRYREALLTGIAQTQTPQADRFLLSWFERSQDSVHYRQAILTALARVGTSSAMATFARLLSQQPVYLTENQLDEIFTALDDSLPLCVPFLPRWMDLAAYPPFQANMLKLLESGLRRGLVKPKMYARLKPLLLREAAWLLSQRQYERNTGPGNPNALPYYPAEYSYAASGIASVRNMLELLAPFLRADKRVQAVFDLALESPDEEVQLIAATLLLRHKRQVPQERLLRFASDDRTRHRFYRNLANAGMLEPYAGWFADTVALVRSILLEEKPETDSVRFLSQHRTNRYGRPATLYFFDVQNKKGKEWWLAYVLVPEGALAYEPAPTDRPLVFTAPDASGRWQPEVAVLYDVPDRDKAAYMQKKIGESRFAGRERYQNGRNYYYGY